MKRITAIIVCLSLLLQCVAHLGVIGYYQLNKEYIAKNLCENRDKPKMNCCGKCYLKKQLRKIDNNTNGTGSQRTVKHEKVEVLYVLPAAYEMRAAANYPVAGVYNPTKQLLHDTAHIGAVFHPPSA